MADIHFILQGKGGVGKSLIATILAEYFISKDKKPHCVDCDAVNQTFASFRKLHVRHLEILKDGLIDPRSFDNLIELIDKAEDDNPFVIDNGSSSFLPVCDYLLSHEIIPMLKEMGHETYIHTVLTGGADLQDTLEGFIAISMHFSEIPLVVWRNEFFGGLENNGKSIDDEAVFTDHLKNVFAQIVLPKPQGQTFGRDLIELRAKKQTLLEGINNEKFTMMMRRRLNILQSRYFTALENARL